MPLSPGTRLGHYDVTALLGVVVVFNWSEELKALVPVP